MTDKSEPAQTRRPARAKTWRGGCLCGAVRFEATGVPRRPHTCSCRMCQRHTGSITAVWIEFPSDAVRWTGPAGAPATWRSSSGSSRAFCPACGSTLGAIDDAPVIALTTGVFDDPKAAALRPSAHSFRAQRPKWWHVEITSD